MVAPLRGSAHGARDPWVPRRLVTHGYCCFGATRHRSRESGQIKSWLYTVLSRAR